MQLYVSKGQVMAFEADRELIFAGVCQPQQEALVVYSQWML